MDKHIFGFVFLMIVSIGLVQYERYSYEKDDADYKSAYMRILKDSSLSENDSKAIVAVIKSETDRNRSMVESVVHIALILSISMFVGIRVSESKRKTESITAKGRA